MSKIYDLIIVGAGPSGLSAAIYMARAKYNVLVLEQDKIGGQITITSEVVNYPGIIETSGSALTSDMHKQAEKFGAKFQTAKVTDMDCSNPVKKIVTDRGEFETLSVILALGANPRKLGFQGEQEFQGRGVAYCATCDGEFFKDMDIYVVGGGFAAVEEGIFLTKYGSHVHMIVRGKEFSCAKTVADKALNHDKITVHFETEVDKVEGESTLNSITMRSKTTGETQTFTDPKGIGVFVFAGYVPNTGWVSEKIDLKDGYIVTTPQGATNVPGVYAAGDVCIKELRQVVTAVSDGATAATSLEKYVEPLRKELNLPEFTPEPEKSPQASQGTSSASAEGDFSQNSFITAEMVEQLGPVLSQFSKDITLKAFLGSDDLAEEMSAFATETASISDKIHLEINKTGDATSYLELFFADGKSSGTQYHTVPGGHEFNSFLLGMFQMSNQAKPIPAETLEKIQNLKKTKLQVLITLSCTMCPDVVVACQRIAFENPEVETQVIDIGNRADLREKHKVMSVPCLLINETQAEFGKKNLDDILTLIKS